MASTSLETFIALTSTQSLSLLNPCAVISFLMRGMQIPLMLINPLCINFQGHLGSKTSLHCNADGGSPVTVSGEERSHRLPLPLRATRAPGSAAPAPIVLTGHSTGFGCVSVSRDREITSPGFKGEEANPPPNSSSTRFPSPEPFLTRCPSPEITISDTAGLINVFDFQHTDGISPL